MLHFMDRETDIGNLQLHENWDWNICLTSLVPITSPTKLSPKWPGELAGRP